MMLSATELVAQGLEVSAVLSISKWYKKRMRECDQKGEEIPKRVRQMYVLARQRAQQMIDEGAEFNVKDINETRNFRR